MNVGTLRVLVVDGDASARSVVEATLRSRGHDVVACPDAASALRAWEREVFPLVIVDPDLPDRDGLEVCRTMRGEGWAGASTILACTRRRSSPELEALLDAGADDYIGKPLRPASLTARLLFLEHRLAAAAAQSHAPGRPAPSGIPPAERYELVALLGHGGSAEVYRAHDRELDEMVALKLLSRDASADAVCRGRIKSEIKIGRSVRHPSICPSYDIGMLGDRLFLTMELIDGVALDAKVHGEGPFDDREAVDLLLPAVDGIAAIHRLGIVHRDLKPGNLMRARDGRTVVLDFGLARRSGDARLTSHGRVTGTPAYMAPEQLLDRPLSPATDVWALGCVLHFLVSGENPFPGIDVLQAVARILHEEPRPLRSRGSAANLHVDAIVARCLRKDPAERFLDAAALATALRSAVGAARCPQAPSRGRVLIGAADPGGSRTLEDALVARGYEVSYAADGYEFVNQAIESGPSAVVAETDLPVIGGIEALRIMRSYPRTADVPAAIVGHSEDDRVLTDIVDKRASFLAPPFDEHKLHTFLHDMGLEAAPR